MESKIDHLMELLKEAGSLANELAAEGIPIKLIAMLEEESGEKEPPRISALRKLLKTNFSDDAMELMLEYPEREFTYRYGRGASKRKDLKRKDRNPTNLAPKRNEPEMERKGRKIKRIEITVDFPKPADGLNIKKEIRKLRKQYQKLTDAKVQIRYLYDALEKL